jgi:DNA polymerase III epsilon subunit-like protein/rubredoxin
MQNHQFETQPDGTVCCTVCTWVWRHQPGKSDDCPGVPRFGYGQVPVHLLTYTQLRQKKLKPRDRDKPDGCYYAVRNKYWLYFYNERQALPRRPETATQKAARERAWTALQEKYRCPECGQVPAHLADLKQFRPGGYLCLPCGDLAEYQAEQEALQAQIAQDWRDAAAWAATMLQRSDWCLLDTETTSLYGYLVEIAILDPTGRILFNRVINPQTPIDPEARAIHQIKDAELATAPTLPEVWSEILQTLAGRTLILTYNAEFDSRILERDAARYQLPLPSLIWECLMLRYAQYVGEWSDYWHSYRWQPLPDGNHRALGDAQAALTLLRRMAKTLARNEESDQQKL